MNLYELITKLEAYENPVDIEVEWLSYGENPLDGGTTIEDNSFALLETDERKVLFIMER